MVISAFSEFFKTAEANVRIVRNALNFLSTNIATVQSPPLAVFCPLGFSAPHCKIKKDKRDSKDCAAKAVIF